MPFLRNAEMWTALYFFMILFFTINYKKEGLWWVGIAVATVIVSNFISSDILKVVFNLIRPCNDLSLSGCIRLLPGLHLPQTASFTSSHAANHFAISTFFYYTLKNEISKWAFLFFIWAVIICYAQMYVGVHYPTDILGGTILGIGIGYCTGKLFIKKIGWKVLNGVDRINIG